MSGLTAVIVAKDHPIPPDLDQRFDPAPFIFEWTSGMASALDTVRVVLTSLSRRRGLGMTSLRYIGEMADPAIVGQPVAPGDLLWDMTSDGDLAQLTCGQNHMSSGLITLFFQNMAAGISVEHVASSMTVFEQYIGKNQSGATP